MVSSNLKKSTQWLNPSKNAVVVQEIQRFLPFFWAVFRGSWLIDWCWSTGCVSSTTTTQLGWWFHLTTGTWPCPLDRKTLGITAFEIIGTSYHPTSIIKPFFGWRQWTGITGIWSSLDLSSQATEIRFIFDPLLALISSQWMQSFSNSQSVVSPQWKLDTQG